MMIQNNAIVKQGAKKAAQACCIWVIVVVVLYVIWAPALSMPQIWMLCAVGILANIFQPSYNPFERSRTPEDRGTAVQILWTVYAVQVLAVAELVIRRPNLQVDFGTWLALGYVFCGLALRTWAVLLLGKWFTWNVEVQTGQEIIQSGPYRFIRHPSYTGAFLMFSGASLLLHSWIAFTIAIAALLYAFTRRIKHEERLLQATLPGYEEYMQRTGAMFPKF